MSDIEKTEIIFLEINNTKLLTIANFLGLPLDDIINASLYLGVYRIWLPIAKIIDEFPDWELNLGDENEILYGLKQDLIKEIHTINKNFPRIEALEKKFNKNFSKKHFQSNIEHYIAFIDYVESQLEEKKPQLPKKVKSIVKKVIPLKVEKAPQKEDSLVPDKKSTAENYLWILFKTIIFVIFFVAPILLILTITTVFFGYNYPKILQYEPVMFFPLTSVMILLGIVFGYVSLLLTRRYQDNALYRRGTHEYKRFKREFNKESPYRGFKGTPTQWYLQLEKFIESKKNDNRGEDSNF